MRIAVAVDWSDQAFNAVSTAVTLYKPTELVLIHAVDLRPFENPLIAPPIAKQAFKEFQQVMIDSGTQLLDSLEGTVRPENLRITRRLEVGHPASVVLNAVASTHPDLLAVGATGKGRVSEVALGSVSHRLFLHAPCATLVVKTSVNELHRVLVAIEGPDDATRLKNWLDAYPFTKAVDVTVVSIVPVAGLMDPATIPALEPLDEATIAGAQALVRDVAASLSGHRYHATGRVLRGHPPAAIAREASDCDMVIVGSHGRKGLERFLVGSVSHAVTHGASCPVLVIR
jgi:nucleotide-binding universal stress UspA family protein